MITVKFRGCLLTGRCILSSSFCEGLMLTAEPFPQWIPVRPHRSHLKPTLLGNPHLRMDSLHTSPFPFLKVILFLLLGSCWIYSKYNTMFSFSTSALPSSLTPFALKTLPQHYLHGNVHCKVNSRAPTLRPPATFRGLTDTPFTLPVALWAWCHFICRPILLGM